MKFVAFSAATALAHTSLAFAAEHSTAPLGLDASLAPVQQCATADWLTVADATFAANCADMAFGGDLTQRQILAWMMFARINQQIADSAGAGFNGGDTVPQWMAWPTDPDTFQELTRFAFNGATRSDIEPSVRKDQLDFGAITTADPDGANEEVTRNQVSYDYLWDQNLITKRGVAEFFSDESNAVDMPVGSIELKASWLQVTDGSPAPEGAIVYQFDSGPYWFRGVHIMMKMRSLGDLTSQPYQVFYSEDPSWFWTTFEFNGNTGIGHVRDTLITQRARLDPDAIAAFVDDVGLGGFGYENLAPNGTQIRFTVDGAGTKPVILGHTDMEDFAGTPNTAQPAYWRHFEASCHSCHASAAYNPETAAFFPFSVPTGALTPSYNMADGKGTTHYLGQGYKPLDFMWPIAFQAQ